MQLCLIMATVGLVIFTLKPLFSGAAFLQRSGSCAENFISAQSLQFTPTIFFSCQRKHPLDHPTWASSEDHSIKIQLEIGLEPEAALEGLDSQSGRPHTLCAGHVVLGLQGRAVPSGFPSGLL